MPLYDCFCPKCDHEESDVLNYGGKIECPECGNPMQRKPGKVMVKMKGEGGYPSRRKQIFNTTKNNHPKLEPEKHRTYFG